MKGERKSEDVRLGCERKGNREKRSGRERVTKRELKRMIERERERERIRETI